LAEVPTPSPPWHLIDRVTVVLFWSALAASFAQFGATSSLNDVARHFGHAAAGGSLRDLVGLSGSALGLGLSIFRVASLGALPLTSLADRAGRSQVLRRTLVLGLVVTAAAALSPGYWFFVLCFALAHPLLTTALTLVQVVTVELSTTARRMQRLVVMAAGVGMGSGLSAILHGVIRGPDSFRWLFALALVGVAALGPLLGSIPEPVSRVKAPALARLGAVPRVVRGRLAIVATMAFTIGVITGPSGGFTFVYSEGILKMSPGIVAVVVTASGAAGLAGLLVSQHFARTLGRRWTVGGGILATSLAATYAYSGGRPGFVVGYVLSIGAGGLLSPAMTAISTEVFPHAVRATANGWITVAGVVGAVAGLALFGWLGDVVRASGSGGLRLPALVTFLPLLPTTLLLTRLPETSAVELD
jgi:MFS family permease